jgi:hypothetical protein
MFCSEFSKMVLFLLNDDFPAGVFVQISESRAA